ncbi:MAG: hypothetical protein J5I91_05860 [Bacteroidetes bacterium]|nr:hypothetical protein [Bacteroidota bacterium]
MKNFTAQFKKWILPAIGLLLLITITIWATIKQKTVVCSEVVIKLEPQDGTYFLTNTHVLQIASNVTSPNDLIGKSLKQLNTYRMLYNLRSSPYVAKANIFLGNDGKLVIDVHQREPLFRVINQQGESYYVEKNGLKIPTVPNYSVRVSVLSGAVDEQAHDSNYIHSEILKGALDIFSFINAEPFWKAQIEQVYVDKNQGFLLIPQVGNHTIVVGKPDNIKSKLEKLKLFYNQALTKKSWDDYSVIDLSFDGQVVAKKRN